MARPSRSTPAPEAALEPLIPRVPEDVRTRATVTVKLTPRTRDLLADYARFLGDGRDAGGVIEELAAFLLKDKAFAIWRPAHPAPAPPAKETPSAPEARSEPALRAVVGS